LVKVRFINHTAKLIALAHGQASLVHDSAHAFHEATVEGFGYAIMLWRVGGSESSLGALLLKITSKLIACKLTAAIGTKTFDACVVLYLHPDCERFVGRKT
jgi:hypothetical protein